MIKNILLKIKNFINHNQSIILLFFIIYIFLLIQHSVMSMYFDDYGNASLSYGYSVKGVLGTNYNFFDMLKWSKYIYFNWGGRLIYAVLFLIPLLKNGIKLYMIAQSTVILLIIYYIYKIVCQHIKSKNICFFVPVIIFILYTLIDIIYIKHGLLWASASVLYVWPMLPLFIFIYYFNKLNYNLENNIKVNKVIYSILFLILIIFVTLSQEQIGIALIAYLIFYFICRRRKVNYKTFVYYDLFVLINSIIFYLLLFVAPGNWVRMDSNLEFAKMSIIEKFRLNFPRILRSIFLDKMNIYMLILCFILLYMIYTIIKKNYKKNKKYFMFIIFIIIDLIQSFIIINNNFNNIIFIILSIIWFISYFVISLFYYKDSNEIEYCAIEVCAMASIFCLLVSPVTGGRTGLPFIFLIIILICKGFIDIIKSKNKIFLSIFILLFAILAFKGLKNYVNVYLGYRHNYEINRLNDLILRKYTIAEEDDEITLYKEADSEYGSTTMYNTPSIIYWVKEYYDIEKDVKIKWVDIYKEIRE